MRGRGSKPTRTFEMNRPIAEAIVGLHFINTALSLEVFFPHFFCLEVEIPSSFISLFICLKLHEPFLAVGNLNAFRPKWKISEMLDYLFLNKQLT